MTTVEITTTVKKYIIKVDPAVNPKIGESFFNRVQDILKMECRWKGYDFAYIGGTSDGWKNPEGTPKFSEIDIIIVLMARDTKHKLLDKTGAETVDQPKKDGFQNPIDFKTVEFSYTFYSTPRLIIIDESNWNNAHTRLKIPKTDYEQYVIFHEVGHAIGYEHIAIPEDKGKPYPIMYQATLGLPDISRFSPFPTSTDYEVGPKNK
jgi:hypothetical protein